MRNKNKVILFIFNLIWGYRFEKTDILKYVCGWRSCVYDNKFGSRAVSTFLFKIGELYV